MELVNSTPISQNGTIWTSVLAEEPMESFIVPNPNEVAEW